MKYVEAPNSLKNLERPWVFLAGGITNCEDWQTPMTQELQGKVSKGTILNPRRANFPMGDPSAAEKQIRWEHQALWRADVVAIWFAGGESVQPIVMFEFGGHLARRGLRQLRHLVVGVDPSYSRKADVELQLKAHNFCFNNPGLSSSSESLDIVPHKDFESYVQAVALICGHIQNGPLWPDVEDNNCWKVWGNEI